VLAVTLCILYEVAVQVAKTHDRRRAKVAAASFAELPDEVASPLTASDQPDAAGDFGVTPIGAPEPVTPPAPTPDTDGPEKGDDAAPSPTDWSDVT